MDRIIAEHRGAHLLFGQGVEFEFALGKTLGLSVNTWLIGSSARAPELELQVELQNVSRDLFTVFSTIGKIRLLSC